MPRKKKGSHFSDARGLRLKKRRILALQYAQDPEGTAAKIEARNKRQRERQRIARQNETEEERARRNEISKERRRFERKNESAEGRAKRLQECRLHQRYKRCHDPGLQEAENWKTTLRQRYKRLHGGNLPGSQLEHIQWVIQENEKLLQGDTTESRRLRSKEYKKTRKYRNAMAMAKFSCEVCSMIVETLQSFTAHMNYHREQNHLDLDTTSDLFFYQCDFPGCDIRFRDILQFNQHILSHCVSSGNGPFTCVVCGKHFSVEDHFQNHTNKAHFGTNLIDCTYCWGILEPGDLDYHLKTHALSLGNPDAEGVFLCEECGVSRSSEKLLQLHVQNVHESKTKSKNQNSQPEMIRPVYQCQVCDWWCYQTKQEQLYLNHMLNTHTYEHGLKCHICDKKFGLRHKLETHVKIHNGTPILTNRFNCKYCTKVFGGQYVLNKHHLLAHRDQYLSEGPYYCIVCHRNFATEEAKDIHYDIHVKWKCPECSLHVISQRAFDEHVKSHQNSTPKGERFRLTLRKRTAKHEQVLMEVGDPIDPKDVLLDPVKESLRRLCLNVNNYVALGNRKNGLQNLQLQTIHNMAMQNQNSNHIPTSELGTTTSESVYGTSNQESSTEVATEGEGMALIFKCEHCNDVFTNLENLNIHRHLIHGIEIPKTSELLPYQCDECDQKFLKECQLTRHKRIHVETSELKLQLEALKNGKVPRFRAILPLGYKKWDVALLTCPLCKKVFDHGNGLKSHMKQHNAKQKKVPASTKVHKDKEEKVAASTMVEILPQEITFKCDKCPRKFLDKRHLDHHLKINRCEARMRFIEPDPEVEKEIPAKLRNRNEPKKKEKKKEKSKCEDCPRYFSSPWCLKAHRQQHVHKSGTRNQGILVKNYATTKRKKGFTHIKNSSNPKKFKYKCLGCPKSFFYLKSLKMHIKSHMDENAGSNLEEDANSPLHLYDESEPYLVDVNSDWVTTEEDPLANTVADLPVAPTTSRAGVTHRLRLVEIPVVPLPKAQTSKITLSPPRPTLRNIEAVDLQTQWAESNIQLPDIPKEEENEEHEIEVGMELEHLSVEINQMSNENIESTVLKSETCEAEAMNQTKFPKKRINDKKLNKEMTNNDKEVPSTSTSEAVDFGRQNLTPYSYYRSSSSSSEKTMRKRLKKLNSKDIKNKELKKKIRNMPFAILMLKSVSLQPRLTDMLKGSKSLHKTSKSKSVSQKKSVHSLKLKESDSQKPNQKAKHQKNAKLSQSRKRPAAMENVITPKTSKVEPSVVVTRSGRMSKRVIDAPLIDVNKNIEEEFSWDDEWNPDPEACEDAASESDDGDNISDGSKKRSPNARPFKPKKSHCDKIYKCKSCEEEFPIREDYRQHRRNAHGSKRAPLGPRNNYSCESCDKIFPNRDKFREHNRLFHKKSRIHLKNYCTRCNEQFDSEESYRLHNRLSHPKNDKIWPCNRCDEKFPSRDLMRDHIREVHLDKPLDKIYECKPCNEEFSSRDLYRKHFTAIHRNRAKEHSSDEGFQCKSCSLKFSNSTAYKTHRDEMHRCHICNMSFVFAISLKRHIESVHKKNPKPYECEVCGEAFAVRSTCDRHRVKAHGKTLASGTLPCIRSYPITITSIYTCHLCNLVCVGRKRILSHFRRHAARDELIGSEVFWTYLCDANDCKHMFQDEDLFYRHLETHANPPHQCQTCPKKFAEESNLLSHQKGLHEDNSTDILYDCKYCDKILKDETQFRNHEDLHKVDLNSSILLGKFICDTCGKDFTTAASLNGHIIRAHGNDRQLHPTAKPGDLIFCPICSEWILPTQYRHFDNHTYDHGLSCYICFKGFQADEYGLLLKHIQKDHNEKPLVLEQPIQVNKKKKLGNGLKKVRSLKRKSKKISSSAKKEKSMKQSNKHKPESTDEEDDEVGEEISEVSETIQNAVMDLSNSPYYYPSLFPFQY